MRSLVEKIENGYLKYAVGLLLLVIPLYPKFPLLAVSESYVSIRLEDFLVAAVLLGWLAVVVRRRIKIWKDPVAQAVGLYLAVVFLASASAVLVTKTVIPHITLFHALRRVEYLSVIFLAASSVVSRDVLRFFVKLILLAAFISALYGFGQKFLALPVISTMNKEFAQGLALSLGPEARVNATFAGHYDLAAYLVPVLVVTLVMVFVYKKRREKAVILLLFFFLVWLMLASASRISFVAYLAVAVGMLFLVKKRKWIIPVVVISVVMAAFSQSLTSRYARLINVTITDAYQRLSMVGLIAQRRGGGESAVVTVTPSPEPTTEAVAGTGAAGGMLSGPEASLRPRRRRPSPTPTPVPVVEDRSMAIRLNVEWPRAVRAVLKNPLLGTGPSSITLATDNDYLRALGETGLVGFLSLAAIFVRVFVLTKPLLRRSVTTLEGAFGWAMLAGTIGLLINAAFIDVLEASKVAIIYWLLVGIWLGAARLAMSKGEK